MHCLRAKTLFIVIIKNWDLIHRNQEFSKCILENREWGKLVNIETAQVIFLIRLLEQCFTRTWKEVESFHSSASHPQLLE